MFALGQYLLGGYVQRPGHAPRVGFGLRPQAVGHRRRQAFGPMSSREVGAGEKIVFL